MHVAVGHRDRVDVGIDEAVVPGHRVGDAVDVVPAAGVEADEALAERGADLHELKRGFELLDQDVGLHGAGGQPQVALQRGEQPVPEGRLLGGLDLRKVEDDRGAARAQRRVVGGHVQRGVDDRGRQAGAVRHAHVAVVQVQAARPEDRGGEVELRAPVVDDRPLQEPLRPGVHLSRDPFGGGQELRRPRDAHAQVALVVQRHGRHLPQGVLAVEHPAVGAGQQGVGDVADAARQRARPAWLPARCPGSTAAAGRRGWRCR